MQAFKRKQIALAVGGALTMVASGAALAGAIPALRTNGVVVADRALAGETQKKALFSASGLASSSAAIKLKLYVTAGAETTATAGVIFADSTGTASTADSAIPRVGLDTAATLGAPDSGNQIDVYAESIGTVAAVNLATAIDSVGGANPPTAVHTVAGAYALTMNVSNAALDTVQFFKVDSAGKLQYSANGNATTPVWQPVKVRMTQDTTGSQGFVTDLNNDSIFDTSVDSAANLLKTFAAQDVLASHTLLPVPTLKTRDGDSNGVVDGLTMETYSPLATFTATNVKGRVKTTGAAGDSANAIADSVAITLTAGGSASTWTLTFDPTVVNWTTGDSAADLAATTKILNTGITNADAPFSIMLDTAAASSLYSSVVVESTGSASVKLRDSSGNDSAAAYAFGVSFPGSANTMADGALPVVRSATYEAGTTAVPVRKLRINFSEAITQIVGGADSSDVKELVENIAYGTAFPGTTLAAANFNDNLAIDSNGATVSIGNSTDSTANAMLTVNDVSSGFLNKALLISKRITLGEPGDSSYAGIADSLGTTNGLDSQGGYASAANEVLSSGGTVTVTAHATSLALSGCTSASGVLDSNNAVFRIDLECGQTLAKDSSATFKDHFKVTVFDDSAAGGSVAPDSTSAWLMDSAVTLSGSTVQLLLPTALARQYMKTLTVDYVGKNWGDAKDALKFASDTAGTLKAVDSGSKNVTLPFFVTAGKAPLFSADMTGTISNLPGSSADGKITAYLAKWLGAGIDNAEQYDSAVVAAGSAVSGGKVTNPGDKVATDLALEFDNTTNILLSVASELNKAKPGKIPVYVELIRSNDAVKGGQNTGGGDTAAGDATSPNTKENFVQAHARLSTTRSGAKGVGAGEKDPIYEVTLDPVSGAIEGRLTGNVKFTIVKSKDLAGNPVQKAKAGLGFLRSDGTFDSVASNAGVVSVAKAIKNNTAFNLLIGVDAPFERATSLQDVFVVTVLEVPGQAAKLVTSGDPGASNYAAWKPNILMPADAPKGRTTALGLVDSTGTAVTLDASKVVANTLAAASTWQTLGVGNLDRKTGAVGDVSGNWTKQFITLNGDTMPLSSFAADGTFDMSLTMAGNAVGIAMEDKTGAVATKNIVMSGGSVYDKRFAFAWANGNGTAQKIWHLTKTAATVALKPGWNLVSAAATNPTACSGSATNCVSHLLQVGANSTPLSWVASDGAMPALTTGAPVFMFVKGTVTN